MSIRLRLALCVGLLWLVSARNSGTTSKAAKMNRRKFFCNPVSNVDPFCAGAAPASVCTENNKAVDGSVLTEDAYNTAVNTSCPKDNNLFTKSVFCKGGVKPFLPCRQASDCDIPASLKQCYGLCMSGGEAGNVKILGAQQCQSMQPQAFCNQRVAAGAVAGPTDAKCLGLTDYLEQEARSQYGASVFRPRKCVGTFPIANHPFSSLDLEGRKQFALELTMKVNDMLGYCRLSSDNTKWVNSYGDMDCLDDDDVYKRPRDIRALRVQLLNGYPTVFIEIKQFCRIPLREGEAMYVNGRPVNTYCDAPSRLPEDIFSNFTKILEDNMGPDESGPFVVGPFPRLTWDLRFEVLKAGKPLWPQQCEYDDGESEPNPPDWVWGLVGISSMLLLLSVLILQHRFRNRVSYARSKDRSASYA